MLRCSRSTTLAGIRRFVCVSLTTAAVALASSCMSRPYQNTTYPSSTTAITFGGFYHLPSVPITLQYFSQLFAPGQQWRQLAVVNTSATPFFTDSQGVAWFTWETTLAVPFIGWTDDPLDPGKAVARVRATNGAGLFLTVHDSDLFECAEQNGYVGLSIIANCQSDVDPYVLHVRTPSTCPAGQSLWVGICLPDGDGDHVPDFVDNCVDVANPNQAITSGNPMGDACMWPNQSAPANSDLPGQSWLRDNHDNLRLMRPKILALNFHDGKTNAEMVADMQSQIDAVNEGSRYHGYAVPSAPAFLDYEVGIAVDLRDGSGSGTSTRWPCESPKQGFFWGTDYGRLFSEEYAALYNIPDGAGNPMDLCELVNAGLVHEVWLYRAGDLPGADCNAAESLELKGKYDYNGNRIGTSLHPCAGNGCFDDEDVNALPAHCTRSIRIAEYLGGDLFTGHNLGHAMENSLTGTGGAAQQVLPYVYTHLRSWADNDLTDRYGTPFPNHWPIECIDYLGLANACRARWEYRTDGTTIDWTHYGRCIGGSHPAWTCNDAADCPGGTCPPGESGVIAPYISRCGMIHFPPNREQVCEPQVFQCTFAPPFPILSSCTHYGLNDGPDAAHPNCANPALRWNPALTGTLRCDASAPFDPANLPTYPSLPSFTEPQERFWIWWRQNLPGLKNPVIDKDGNALHNVWPYLFY